MAAAYYKEYQAQPVMKIWDPYEPIPKLFNYELHEMHRGFAVSLYGAPGGKTGEGKSYSALTMGQAIAPKTFGIDDVTFNISEFLDRLDYFESNDFKYRVLVLDESQTAIPSSAWFSVFNRAIAETVATFRYMRCIAIFVTPLWTWIDKRVRSMIRYGGAPTLVKNEQYGELECRLKFAHISTDLEGEKVYTPKLQFYDETLKQHAIVEYFKVGLPTKDLIDAYEKKAAIFKKQHRKDLKEDVRIVEEVAENKKSVFDPALLFDDLVKNKMVAANIQKKNTVSVPLIEMIYKKMSHRNASKLASYVNNRLIAENV